MSHQDWAHTFNCPGCGYVLPVAVFSLLAFCANADAPPASESKAHLDTITVEAAREHEMVERKVRQFVSGIAVERRDQSLANWQREIPICFLVAGLPRADGEYMLTRLSKIATSAGAPLAPEQCKPNFFVVVTSEPDALLKAWNKRDVRLFESGDDLGGTEIRKFLGTKVPVRAWYNAEIFNSDGTPLLRSGGVGSGFDAVSAAVLNGVRINSHPTATRIFFNDVRDLASVIVLIDAPLAKGITFGQLAAYVGMVGLAEIKIDPKVSGTPSILQLFSGSAEPTPTGLTEWDEAFLKGLYHTEHRDQRQISAIKTAMVQDIAPHR
jgi:hypothetical protein